MRLEALGARGALRHYAGPRLSHLTRRKESLHLGSPTQEFDRRFGVETSQHSLPDDLHIWSANERWGYRYVPSREDIFRRCLQALPIRFEDYLFIDIGAGKGFVLLLASEFPFKRLIGIEYSEALTSIARTNLETYKNEARKCAEVELICADATNFIFPPEPAVLYFFNPFQGKVMDQVITNLERSLKKEPRDLCIIYTTPWERRKFRRCPEFQTIESNLDFCIYRSIRHGS
jgi:SAM-dependent methyltransferase